MHSTAQMYEVPAAECGKGIQVHAELLLTQSEESKAFPIALLGAS